MNSHHHSFSHRSPQLNVPLSPGSFHAHSHSNFSQTHSLSKTLKTLHQRFSAKLNSSHSRQESGELTLNPLNAAEQLNKQSQDSFKLENNPLQNFRFLFQSSLIFNILLQHPIKLLHHFIHFSVSIPLSIILIQNIHVLLLRIIQQIGSVKLFLLLSLAVQHQFIIQMIHSFQFQVRYIMK